MHSYEINAIITMIKSSLSKSRSFQNATKQTNVTHSNNNGHATMTENNM